MTEIVCTSRIARVDVYARGAVVTRAVAADRPLPAGPVVLRIPGLTPLAEAGSVRADLGGGREVVSLRTRLVVPAADTAHSTPTTVRERLRDLDLARQALEAERAHLEWRRSALAQRELRTGLAGAGRFVDPAARAADALAVGTLFTALAADVDGRLADVVQALAGNAREREAAELEASQARSAERMVAGHPTLEVVVSLSGGTTQETLGDLAIVYAVGAARWWPSYAVRLGATAARAEWTLGAFVAQATGEDWTSVRLGLSTADLVHSARLPSLPSLRIGRMQAPPRTGYRAAPADLDALFEGWDRASVDLGLASPPPPPGPTGDTITHAIVPSMSFVERDEVTPVVPPAPARPAAPPAAQRRAPTPAPLPAAAPASRLSSADDDDLEESTAGGMLVADAPAAAMQSFAVRTPRPPARPGAPPAAPAAVVVDRAIEPADSWLDFDSLRLAAAEDRTLRGRLVRESAEGRGERDAAVASIEALASPGMARDPLETRGRFDARWDAAGAAEVPSDTRPHRVWVASGVGAGRTRLRTVPRETAEVFREAALDNPFDVPLLAGPVDVFVEGALVTTASVEAVDRGGMVRLGLGVEDRVRVARNVSVEEGSAGLLGGSTAVQHVVTIDVRSSLGHPVQVEVIDRIPVGGEPEVEVSHTARPEARPYDQSERGRPVKGGLVWLLELPAAGETKVELRYRVKIPGSSELVGGNRRE